MRPFARARARLRRMASRPAPFGMSPRTHEHKAVVARLLICAGDELTQELDDAIPIGSGRSILCSLGLGFCLSESKFVPFRVRIPFPVHVPFVESENENRINFLYLSLLGFDGSALDLILSLSRTRSTH